MSTYSTNFLIRADICQDLHLHIDHSFLQGLEIKLELWGAMGTRLHAAPGLGSLQQPGLSTRAGQDLSKEPQPRVSKRGQDEVWTQGSLSRVQPGKVLEGEGVQFPRNINLTRRLELRRSFGLLVKPG